MLNKLFSFFNTGTINQTNINNYNISFKTQVSQIKRTFNDGKIKIAFDDIQEAKKECQNSRIATYEFLILELQFYCTLRDFNKIEELVIYIKENFNELLDLKFYEVQATLFSFQDKNTEFVEVINKMKFEFGASISEQYTELVFLLNSKQLEIAQEKYKEYEQSTKTFDKSILFTGAMIYSELFFKNSNKDYFIKAKEIYELLLSEHELDIYDKIDIYSRITFYHLLTIHNGLEADKNYQAEIEITLNLLLTILDDLSYFGESLRINLLNCILHCYALNKQEEEFVNIYTTFNESEINIVNFMLFNIYIQNPTNSIDYPKVEARILQAGKMEFITYIDDLYKIGKYDKIISFINDHRKYTEDEVVLSIYCASHFKINRNISDDILSIIFENKNNSLTSYLTFLEVQQNEKKEEISKEMIDRLESYFDEPIESNILIIKALKILIKNNYLNGFFDLLFRYSNNNLIVAESLKLIYKDRNVYLLDIEKVLEKIDTKEHLLIIGNIYEKFGLLTKAYEFYTQLWKAEKNYIDFTCSILGNCSLSYFIQNKGNKINEKQDNIFVNFLIKNIEELTFLQLCILSSYLIVVQKQYSNGFYYLNRKLLTIDVLTLENEIKESLSKLYFYTITTEKPGKIQDGFNLILKKDGEYYLSQEIYTDIDPSYNFKLLKETNFKLLSQDKDEIEELSCFHMICNHFLHSMKSNNFISIQGETKDLIKNIEQMTLEQYNNNKSNIERYSSGDIISFYTLSNKNYDAYFKMIPSLYEDTSINFDAGHLNPTQPNTKKLLTLSSIIFIDHLGKLDYILSKEEVYIQQTTVDYLIDFIERLNSQDEILTVFNDGSQMKTDISGPEQIKKDREYLISLATKITKHDRVINDREATLNIAESENLLAPTIGRLEYKAMAIAVKENFQIISEDRTFEFMFNKLNFNLSFVSNSTFLLIDDILTSNPDVLGEYFLKLHKKRYKYIFNKAIALNNLRESIFENPQLTLIQGHEGVLFKSMIIATYSYGWMEEFDKYYENNYEFKIGMTKPPQKDFIAKNIEYIRKASNYFNEKEFAENKATESFKNAQQEAYRKHQHIIVSEDDGYIYEKSSRTEKRMLKKTHKKVSVDISKEVDLS